MFLPFMILDYGWKNSQKDYIIIFWALLPPATVAPRVRGIKHCTNNLFWMNMGRKPKQAGIPQQQHRKPQQDRSVRSMAKMLDAAEAIFAKGGDNSLTAVSYTHLTLPTN